MFPALALALATVTAQLPPWQTGESRPEDLRISLVTFGPGDTLTEWWGHTSLVVEDVARNHGRLYNYGMFGFSSGFVHKFIQGRLEFWVEDASIGGTYQLYRYLNRDVRIQELNFTPEEALLTAKALADNVLPENKEYLYHHYNDNCSTRPRDIIDRAFRGQLKAATSGPARMKIRAHTRRYSQVSPPMLLVLDYLQNNELDHAATQQQEAFLPDELERQLDALTVTRLDGTKVPAVKRKWNWFTARRTPVPEEAPEWTLQLLALGTLLGAAGFFTANLAAQGKRSGRLLFALLNFVLGLGLGTLGLGLFGIGFFTDHMVAHHNENLFLISPITFAALPLSVMLAFNSARAVRALRWVWGLLLLTTALGLLGKVLPMFDQNNWNLITLMLPINVGFAVGAWRLRQRTIKPA